MKYLYIIVALVLFSACKESEKDRILRLVKEWEGKEIVFPKHSVFTIQGKDTVEFSHADADYKVLTYVDSMGCISCKLQLHRWKELVYEVDSLMNGAVPFLFYFHPQDVKGLRYLMLRDNFTYPICFDEMDDFNRLNRFPSEITFQTFLLDKDNKVVALGNPIYNPKVKEIYLQVLTRKQKLQSKQIITQVSVDTDELDFGSFPYKEKQERKFILSNTGDKPLVVHDVTTACGCTRVTFSKQPVRPGESMELKVIYTAENTEHFRKDLKVYCNAEGSPFRLTVKGIAE